MSDLEKYCRMALERGVTHAKQIRPSSVVTAAWVRWKCQFGCGDGYNKGYCCPPETPTHEETRAVQGGNGNQKLLPAYVG